MRRTLLLPGLVASLAFGIAGGRATEDPLVVLTKLYRLDLALAACSGIDATEAEQNRLDAAIDAAERASRLDEAARQKLYDEIEAAAESDTAGFCRSEVPGLHARLETLPP